MWTDNIVRVVTLVICFASLAACKSSPHLAGESFAELDVFHAPECQQPSVRFRELRDKQARQVSTRHLPTQVRSGDYSIGLSCGSIFDSEHNACVVPKGRRSQYDVPTYSLVLRPRVRYSFRCDLIDGQWTYRMIESAL